MKTPYDAYRKTPAWKAIAKQIKKLKKNKDIKIKTHRDLVVGSICEAVVKNLGPEPYFEP